MSRWLGAPFRFVSPLGRAGLVLVWGQDLIRRFSDITILGYRAGDHRRSDFVIELRLCGETASTEVQRVSMKETSPRVPTVGLNAQFPWASKLSL